MANKVIYAKLHEGVFIPGTGSLGDTLPPQNKTLKNFSMEKQQDGTLQLSWDVGGLHEVADVGASNIVVLKYAPEKRSTDA